MTLCGLVALEESPASDLTLAVLANALDGRTVRARHRVLATEDSRNPDEGLALLDAYIGIADPSVRQAVLDAVIAIAGSDPYRRARGTTARASGGRAP